MHVLGVLGCCCVAREWVSRWDAIASATRWFIHTPPRSMQDLSTPAPQEVASDTLACSQEVRNVQ